MICLWTFSNHQMSYRPIRPIFYALSAVYCIIIGLTSIQLLDLTLTLVGSTKQRLHPKSVAEISRHSVLSGDRIQQCGVSSGSRHKDTDQCLSVAISFCRHRSVPVPCKNGSVETTHCCRWRSKPGCRIVGSHTRWEFTTWADFQFCLRWLLMSTGCKSNHSGFLDVSRSDGGLRISGWIGQLSRLTIFSTSLSVAAFLRRVGSSIRPYSTLKWLEVNLKSTTWNQNDLTQLRNKTTTLDFQSTPGMLLPSLWHL